MVLKRLQPSLLYIYKVAGAFVFVHSGVSLHVGFDLCVQCNEEQSSAGLLVLYAAARS